MNAEQKTRALLIKYSSSYNEADGIYDVDYDEIYKNWYLLEKIRNIVEGDEANCLLSDMEELRKFTKLLQNTNPPPRPKPIHLYPITILASRYGGIYSGGKYIAFNLGKDRVPLEALGSDITCADFYSTTKLTYGVGSSPSRALKDLALKITDRKINLEGEDR